MSMGGSKNKAKEKKATAKERDESSWKISGRSFSWNEDDTQ